MEIELVFSLLGMVLIPVIAWLMSVKHSVIMWKVVFVGMGIQFVLGILVMLTEPGQLFFQYMNDIILGLLAMSDEGSRFIFGNLVDSQELGAQFAFSVLPTIIFFSCLMAVAYYSGLMQKVVELFAWVMMKLLGTSGAETLSVSSNIFVGQTEAPLVVRPFIKNMTMSEINTIMTSGFATVAGGVMAAFVGMLSDDFPGIAGHLMTASIMSAPAAIVMSKLCYPETEDPETGGEMSIEIEQEHENVLDAAAGGAKSGLTLAFNVASMLLAFIALVAMGNAIFGWYGNQVLWMYGTESTPGGVFAWGMALGGFVMLFLVARVSWRDELTKFWLGGNILLFGLPAGGYFLVPEFMYERFGVGPSAGFWRNLGLITCTALALGVAYTWQKHRMGRWIRSLGVLLAGGVVLGFITLMTARTQSGVMAASYSAGLLAFFGFLALFWFNPGTRTAMILAVITVAGAVLGGLAATFTGAEILGESGIMAELTLQLVMGYAFSLMALLMGIPFSEIVFVGQLIGEQIVINEFVAFFSFQELVAAGELSPRSIVIASYALCGFSNFSSIAIQIGGIGGIAPSRTPDLAKLGLRAMFAGALASWQTATVAGVMFSIAEVFDIDLIAGEMMEAGAEAVTE